jgi:hypothetical protein
VSSRNSLVHLWFNLLQSHERLLGLGELVVEEEQKTPDLYQMYGMSYNAVINTEQRGNNTVEIWHNIQKIITVHHPSFWKFIEALKNKIID